MVPKYWSTLDVSVPRHPVPYLEIFREIKVGAFRSSKTAIFAVSEVLNFVDLVQGVSVQTRLK